MSIAKPNFVDSPYFVAEDGNWHLKEGAPEEVQKEFDEYVKYVEDLEKRGIDA